MLVALGVVLGVYATHAVALPALAAQPWAPGWLRRYNRLVGNGRKVG